MLISLIAITLAFAWLLAETDFLRVRLESTEYQRANRGKVKLDMPEALPKLKPLVFNPLDMPKTKGRLNIICKRC